MLRHSTTAFLLTLSVVATAQTTYELTNMGTTFVPSVINMVAGDSIHLVLGNLHTCTEVEQATWNANQSTSNGGFDYAPGEYTFALDQAGTYYYVCVNHVANMGMKGQFIVAVNTGIKEPAGSAAMQIFPNPASTQVTVSGVATGQVLNVLDLNGRMVFMATTTVDGSLDVSKLDVGTYTVIVKDEQGGSIAKERLVITR